MPLIRKIASIMLAFFTTLACWALRLETRNVVILQQAM